MTEEQELPRVRVSFTTETEGELWLVRTPNANDHKLKRAQLIEICQQLGIATDETEALKTDMAALCRDVTAAEERAKEAEDELRRLRQERACTCQRDEQDECCPLHGKTLCELANERDRAQSVATRETERRREVTAALRELMRASRSYAENHAGSHLAVQNALATASKVLNNHDMNRDRTEAEKE